MIFFFNEFGKYLIVVLIHEVQANCTRCARVLGFLTITRIGHNCSSSDQTFM